MRCHTVRFASSITLPVRIVDYVKSVTSARERVMSKCITCKKTKDRFSREWEYQQCQACSMKGDESE